MKIFARSLFAVTCISIGLVAADASAEVVFTADGIPGTSLLAKPPAPNAIEAQSFSLSTAGKPELVIVRRADKASIPLLAANASNQRWKSVTAYSVDRRAPGGGVLYRVTLMDASLTSVKQSAGDNDATVQETLTFDFGRAEIEIFSQDPKGGVTSAGKVTIPGRK